MKKHFKTILLGLLIFASIGGGVGWYFIQQKLKPKDDYIQNCDKAYRIYEQIIEFEKDYLGVPSAEAMEGDDEMVGLELSSSNGYLAQLIIGAGMDSEDLFFIAGSSCCLGAGPDNIVAPVKNALSFGENGWAYFKGRNLDDSPARPILVPGYNPNTQQWDDALWKYGIPVLFTDGSVVLYRAESDGEEGGYQTTKEALPFTANDPDLVQPAQK